MRYFRRTYTTPSFTLFSPDWRGGERQAGGNLTSAELFVLPHMDSLKTPEHRWSRHVVMGTEGPSVPYGLSKIQLSKSADKPHVFRQLFVDEDLRHAAPTLAALTLGTPERLGLSGATAPDESLSIQSSRLARRALDKGLVVPNRANPTAEGEGRYGQRHVIPVERYSNMVWPKADQVPMRGYSPWQEIPHEEVQEARTRVRQFLRGR
jgi:hypothetical protein